MDNIAYDHGPEPVSEEKEQKGTRRRKPQGEKEERNVLPPHIKEHAQLAIKISGTETLGGMYALLLTSLGIAFPVSQYTSSREDAKMRDSFDIGFGLFVYVVSLAFQLYITSSVRFHKIRKQRQQSVNLTSHKETNGHEIETSLGGTQDMKKTESRGEIYVIDDGVNKNGVSVPESCNQQIKSAPSLYETKYGFNIFTRIGVLLFGVCAVALDVCRLVEYDRPANARCYSDALRVLAIIRIIFYVFQSLFLFIHHKVVINFHHPLMKIGLLHLLAANLIAWVDMIAVSAIDIVALDQQGSFDNDPVNSHTAGISANVTSVHEMEEETLAHRLCLGQDNIAVLASRYLGPLVIGYCVLSASIMYKMYVQVGPFIYFTPSEVEIWEQDGALGDDERPQCGKPNMGLIFGIPLFSATLGLTVWYLYLDFWKGDGRNLKTEGRIYVGCDLFWNIVILIALAPAFYQLHKLKYKDEPVQMKERILVAVLGGTFVLMGFVTVACFMYIDHPEHGGSAKMAVPGAIMNFVQCSAMFAFVIDALRRRLVHPDKMHGKDSVGFLIIANLSVWLITSFQLKASFGSYLFYVRYGVLPWVLIINTTLPLAMFFRFLVCILLTDMLRTTYGLHVHRRKCLMS